MEGNYYSERLNAERLLEVYQTGIERIKQYLEAEINYVRKDLVGRERIIELGAGYGRIMKEIAPFAASILGVEISMDSVVYGKEYLRQHHNCQMKSMDAHKIEYNSEFDVVLCLQNGLSAIKGDPMRLIDRCLKALVPGGRAYFSTYSSRFWQHRLKWFMEQSEKGLLGQIDLEKTKDGQIVCCDGFTATTFSMNDLEKFGLNSGQNYRIEEVDESSLFLVINKSKL